MGAEADAAQLPLFAGFEHLPKRIRAGRASLPLDKVTVAQFLAYKQRYEQRAERDQRVVDDLRRLANSVANQDTALTMAGALERIPRLVRARDSAS